MKKDRMRIVLHSLILCSLTLFALGVQPSSRTDAQGFIEKAQIALQEVPSLPASPVNVVIAEARFPPGSPPITHRHGMGWQIITRATQQIRIGDQVHPLLPGDRFWIPAEVEHEHILWDATEESQFRFIGIGTNLTQDAHGGRVLAAGGGVQMQGTGPQVIFLHRISFSNVPSNFTLIQGLDGLPGVLIGIEGAVRYDNKTIRPWEIVLLRPDVNLLFNVPNERGVVWRLQFLARN